MGGSVTLAPAITELSAHELALRLHGQPGYRSRQLTDAVYRGAAADFAGVSTLPHELRARLASELRYSSLIERTTQRSMDGTRKVLFALAGGGMIESVEMPSERGPATTACLSSQAGCGMGCTFCATGALGLTRNLSAAEIVDQFLHLRRTGQASHRADRVVFMGMGEPLANLGSLRAAIDVLVDAHRVGLGARRITVSTVGLPAGIHAMADWGLPLGLAISLHAPLDELRAELIPPARKINLDTLLASSRRYQIRVRRRVTYEVTLLDGVNDEVALARRLAHLVRGHRCHVNLIPFNTYPGARFRAAAPAAVRAFRDVLRRGGVPATIRRTRGRDIAGACGQLHAGSLGTAPAP